MNRIAQFASTSTGVALRRALESRISQVLDEAVTIQQIPAPTFGEGRRAAYIQQRFGQIVGLDSIATDAVYNVYARLPGVDPARSALLVSAHSDTVFDAQTPLDAQRRADTIYGPGIGDNSLGVASILAAAELLAGHRLPGDIWFVANSREEGLGDLGGIRAVYERLAPRLGSALVVEGMALGRIYHSGIAVRRLRITCRTPGGHSWLHFGRPSAIHALVSLGADIAKLKVPESPRTTYNIGMIAGGRSVNSIASEASLLLDLRSESRETLAALENAVLALIDKYRAPEQDFQIEVVGDRPIGSIPRTHPLVQMASEVLASIGIRPTFENGSTDANALLAQGLPTVTIGITYGGNAHRVDEYIEVQGVLNGLWQLALLIVCAAGGMT